MKTKLILLYVLPLFFIFKNKASCQIAHEYLLSKGYAFPVESTLAEIDSIEKVRQFYKNKNDSLFLENTIYQFERLVFLPDEERAKFDYITYHEIILGIDVSDFDVEKIDAGKNLFFTWIFIQREAADRLIKYYYHSGKIKDAEKNDRIKR